MKEEKREMKELKFDLELQKEVAKIGMSATLGATVVTSMFMKNKIAIPIMATRFSIVVVFSTINSRAIAKINTSINEL